MKNNIIVILSICLLSICGCNKENITEQTNIEPVSVSKNTPAGDVNEKNESVTDQKPVEPVTVSNNTVTNDVNEKNDDGVNDEERFIEYVVLNDIDFSSSNETPEDSYGYSNGEKITVDNYMDHPELFYNGPESGEVEECDYYGDPLLYGLWRVGIDPQNFDVYKNAIDEYCEKHNIKIMSVADDFLTDAGDSDTVGYYTDTLEILYLEINQNKIKFCIKDIPERKYSNETVYD